MWVCFLVFFFCGFGLVLLPRIVVVMVFAFVFVGGLALNGFDFCGINEAQLWSFSMVYHEKPR